MSMTPFALLAALAVAHPARATAAEARPCLVQVEPATAARPWRTAADALARQLRAGPAGDRDCRQVLIHAAARRPSVEVVTADGRHGVRFVTGPAEVGPTVSALIVTVPFETARPPAAAPPASPSPPPPAPSAELSASPPAAASSPARLRLLVAAGGGARVSALAGVAPLAELAVGLAGQRWEATLYGTWTAAAADGNPAGSGGTSWTGEAGAGAALRLGAGAPGPDGARSVLLAGARAGVLRSSPSAVQTGDNNSDPFTAPAFTVLVGAALARPALGPVRLRPQLWGQWIPAARFSAEDPAAASTLWSAGASLGVESGLP